MLDKLQVERERGITVKAQTASLIYKHKDDPEPYLLNLVDTPVSTCFCEWRSVQIVPVHEAKCNTQDELTFYS